MTATAAVFAILVALWLGATIPGPSFVLVRAKQWVDRIAAGAIAALGVRLILTAPKAGI